MCIMYCQNTARIAGWEELAKKSQQLRIPLYNEINCRYKHKDIYGISLFYVIDNHVGDENASQTLWLIHHPIHIF